MNTHHYLKLIFALSLFMVTVQVTAEKPLSTSLSDPAYPSSEQAAPPRENLLKAQVSRDPVTGQIEISPGSGSRTWTLSPRELNMLSRSDEGLQATVLANGAVAVNLRGRFQSMVTTASDLHDHRLKMSCSIVDAASMPVEQTINGN